MDDYHPSYHIMSTICLGLKFFTESELCVQLLDLVKVVDKEQFWADIELLNHEMKFEVQRLSLGLWG